MNRVNNFGIGALLFALSISAQAVAMKPGDYYVTSNETSKRLSPNNTEKVTNTLFKRQKVTVLELEGEWAVFQSTTMEQSKE